MMGRQAVVFAGLALAGLSATGARGQANSPSACGLLSRAAIAKATGLHVSKGKEGPPISGSLSNCIWLGPNGAKIVVTLADAERIKVTMQSQLQCEARQVHGLGSRQAGS